MLRAAAILVLLFGGSYLVAADSGLLQDAQAQEIPELPDSRETAATGIQITIIPEQTFARIPENGRATYNIKVTDRSIESAFAYTPSTPITCTKTNQTQIERGWVADILPIPPIRRNQETETQVTITAGIGASPRTYRAEFTCEAGNPLYREIARFDITAQVEAYHRFALVPSGIPPRVGPDEPVSVEVQLFNSGNVPTRFRGSVEAPEGWIFQEPPPVIVPSGGSTTVEVTGLSPREQLYYRAQAGTIIVSFWPEGAPERAQHQYIPATVQGLYFHPALIPVILLGLVASALLLILIAYARKTLAEQVLGKPVPPWQIPVERAYLKELQRTDPDEFYIVRYYLMVEEHRSALLWYKHYKHATRKDRKRETVWVRRRRRLDRKIRRKRQRVERMEALMVGRGASFDEERRLDELRLRRRYLRKAAREQRRLLRIHRRAVGRIDKLHGTRAAGLRKAHARAFAEEMRRVAKQNKRRAKRGEDLLPVPEETEPVISAPSFPDPVQVPIEDLKDSAYAVRLERRNRRADRQEMARRSRMERKRGRRVGRLTRKLERLERRLPPEPETHLYEEDAYLTAEQATMADDRTLLQRALRVRPLEIRDRIRRRREVYRARAEDAKRRGDEEGLALAKEQYRLEKASMLRGEWEAGKPGPDPSAKDVSGTSPPSRSQGGGTARAGSAGRALLRKKRGKDNAAASPSDDRSRVD